MANSDKDILITTSTGLSALPSIKFNGLNNTPIFLRVLDDGTTSFEGVAGQLFSISDGLTGTLFSVNDISGVPSLEVLDNGTVRLAPFSGVTTVGQIFESATINTVAATGTVNYDILSNRGVTFNTTAASANWTLNVRGSSTTTLNSLMSNGQSFTFAFINTNSTTGWYLTGIAIDGTNQTIRWQGGITPAAGTANAFDMYAFHIIKTANATYTVFGSSGFPLIITCVAFLLLITNVTPFDTGHPPSSAILLR